MEAVRFADGRNGAFPGTAILGRASAGFNQAILKSHAWGSADSTVCDFEDRLIPRARALA